MRRSASMRRAAAVRMSEDACAQVSVALTMSGCGASWWTDLAITLNWKLAATGAALRAGEIDLSRTCLIAEATRPLDDDTARVVEARCCRPPGSRPPRGCGPRCAARSSPLTPKERT